jgi:SAM-dependent methyltransferase
MVTPAVPAQSFGQQAALYDRVRPSYPPEAVAAVLPDGASTAADVGAGTGKLTCALVERGLRVIAVEPDDSMRAVLRARVPKAEVRAGTAEVLPIGDSEVDAVMFGQAWHWADSTVAAGEARRVLRRGGALGLLWNMDDDRDEWVSQLKRVTGSGARISRFGGPEAVPGFCAGHRHDTAWPFTLRRDELVGLVRTWGSVSTLSDADRLAVMDALEQLLSEHPDLTRDGMLTLPQVCVALTYRPL